LIARIPRAARICALIAVLNALLWAIIVPPFQVPDEIAHVGYTQYFAETGKLPSSDPGDMYSTELDRTISGLDLYFVVGNRADKPPWSVVQQQQLDREENGRRDDGGKYTVAVSNPPLYYGIEAVAYHLIPGSTTLTRLYAMRVVSVLMAGLTVLLVFFFLRELLPGTPWAWTAGSLAVAFQPMFGFESGGVNNDNLLYLCSAALFYALARAFRRGLDTRSGVLIGASLGLGLITKFTMAAFAPAAAAAVLWLVWRATPEKRAAALRGMGWAAALTFGPFLVYALLNATVWGRGLLTNAAGTAPAGPNARPVNLRQEISYMWQLFLPRLPFMDDTFPNAQPLWDTWFTGFNGRFGWLDYAFPASFYRWIFWLVYLPIIGLAVAALVRWRAALRRHLAELAVYALAVVGLVVVIGRPSYTSFLTDTVFYQPRYVLPLLPLFAAIVGLAVRGSGRRWAPIVATVIVFLAATHTLLAQLMTLSRYYG
jgi:4-amino-4-deoxy-L-arabinose transferase-like glycosyltransferase